MPRPSVLEAISRAIWPPSYPVEAMAPTAGSTVLLVFAAKAVRTFCYGYLGVLLPLHLAALGLGAGGIGVAVTLTLGASAVLTLLIRRPVERRGGRAVLIALAWLVVVAGVLLATARVPGLVVLAAMLGNVAVSTGETGPFLSIEQVLVARAAAGRDLTLRMSLYNLVGYVASGLGALTVAALPAGGYGLLFWLFALSGGVQALLYARLPDVPVRAPMAGAQRFPSRRLIYRIAALFALDSFAGGFVLQSLLVYWLYAHFALTPAAIGAVFSAAQLLTACSVLLAVRASHWFGLVNTMVFSHLASNVLLVAMGLAPTAGLAVGLLLLRALLSQMDVPTRQAFLMLVVRDDEREATATVTNAGRTVAQAVSPALTGYVMQAVSLSAPFVLGGVLKIVYDLLLYQTCRRVVPVSARERAG
jgi:predicted MFS family arabinose efflux permease